jgi:hypothetical protein
VWLYSGAGGCEMRGVWWDVLFGEKRGLGCFASQLTRTSFYFTPAAPPVSEGPANRSIANILAL